MSIKKLNKLKEKFILYPSENDRDIKIFQIKDAQFLIGKTFYPDLKLKSLYSNEIIDPIDETIMSLKKINTDQSLSEELVNFTKIQFDPVFLFIYNTENYYHFVYDTLPYLISYKKLKQQYQNLKLLINYPNSKSQKNYKFVLEFLEMLEINQNECIYVHPSTLYKNLFVSSSYTHGENSNLAPRKEIYDLYQSLVEKNQFHNKTDIPKVYISRRTWLHNQNDNIGTDYTTRRRMINETELVEKLQKKGYKEIFSELLTTKEKIQLFSNAEKVIGPIGGGLCNVLFSNKNCELYCIVSPTFLNINARFLHSFSKVKTTLINKTEHIEKTNFKKNMRIAVEINGKKIIGEIISLDDNFATIIYTNEKLAGWNNKIEYKETKVNLNKCEKLDDGLNSEWKLDLQTIDDLII